MATRRQIEDTYDFMDEIFRLSFGDNPDLTCAFYDGDFSKSLAQAQRDKHNWVLEGVGFSPGARILDIGCGYGPILKAVEERGGEGIGLTLSARQADICRRSGLDVHVIDWKDVTPATFGVFDAIVSIGAFEHFCSVEDYLAGRQEQIYSAFFRLCHDLLPPRGRLYLQTMMIGQNAPRYEDMSLDAPAGSDEYVAAIAMEFFPGSWLPLSEDQILRVASSCFEPLSSNSGRLDYLETIRQWSKLWNFTPANVMPPNFSWARLMAMARLLPRFVADAGFRRRTEFLRKGYDQDCFGRSIIDHRRMLFSRRPASGAEGSA